MGTILFDASECKPEHTFQHRWTPAQPPSYPIEPLSHYKSLFRSLVHHLTESALFVSSSNIIMSAKDTLVPMGTVGDAVATEDPKTEAVDKPVAPTTATKDSFTPASTKDEAVDKSIVPKTAKEDPVASTSTEVYVANTSVTPATVTEDSLEAPENVVVPEIDVDQAEVKSFL